MTDTTTEENKENLQPGAAPEQDPNAQPEAPNSNQPEEKPPVQNPETDKAPAPEKKQKEKPVKAAAPVVEKAKLKVKISLVDAMDGAPADVIVGIHAFCLSIGTATDRDIKAKLSGLAGTIAGRCLPIEEAEGYVASVNEVLQDVDLDNSVAGRLTYYCTEKDRGAEWCVNSICGMIDEIALSVNA